MSWTMKSSLPRSLSKAFGGPNVQHDGGISEETLRAWIREDLQVELADIRSSLKDICANIAPFSAREGTRSPSPRADTSEPDKDVSFWVSSLNQSTAGYIPLLASDTADLTMGSTNSDLENACEGEVGRRSSNDNLPQRNVAFAASRWHLLRKSLLVFLVAMFSHPDESAICWSRKPTMKKGMTWTNRGQPLKHEEEKSVDSLASFVKSTKFETTAGVLVLLNSIFIGIEANLQCEYHLHPPRRITWILEFAEAAFMFLFLTEWLLRLWTYRGAFFSMEGWQWNIFDTIVVASQVMEQILTLVNFITSRKETEDSFSLVGVLRILRLLRIARMVRLLHLFDELGMLVNSILASFHTLMWALVLMLAMVYAFSVFFAQRVEQITHGHLEPRLDYYFGSVPRTWLTMMECILSGISWDEPVMLLFVEIGWFSGLMCVMFVTIGLFVLVNIVTGVFIDRMMRTAGAEEDRRIAEELAVAFGLSENGVTWNNDREEQQLDFDKFKQKLSQPALKKYFEKINLDVDDDHLQRFFDILDVDGSGDVTAEEIYGGCLRLRGPVRAVDLAIQTYVQNQQLEEQNDQLRRMEQKLGMIMSR